MSMSSAGRAENSNGCVTRPKGREIGLSGFAAQIQLYSLTGSYVMATAEHREPYESRGSRTVLGARGGEIPPRDSTFTSLWLLRSTVRMSASHPKATEFAAQQRNDAQCRYLRARSGKILLQQYLPTPDLDCGAPNGARGDVSWRLTMRRAY